MIKAIITFVSFLPLIFHSPYLMQAWTGSRLDHWDWIFYLTAVPAAVFAMYKGKSGKCDFYALFTLIPSLLLTALPSLHDINAIARRVKAKNPRVIFHSDGVQAYGKIPFKLAKEVDLYSVSAHKIGGLKGVGGLIKRKSLVLPPYVMGGGQESGRRSGTENTFGIMQFQYAVESKFSTLKQDLERIHALRERLWTGMDKTVYTRLSSMDGTPYILLVSAVGLRGEVLLHMANDKGLIIGTGSACSSNSKNRYSKVVLACGFDEKTADGVLRFSFSPETTEEEIDKTIEIVNEIGQDLSKRMK